MIKKILLLLFFISFTIGHSQKREASVMVNARAQKDKILIRWGINNPIEWQRTHKKGFIVNRFTIKRDGKALAEPEKILLTPKPLVPAPLASWMDLIQKDNNAAIIAQSIYGESFSVTDTKKEGALSKIINIADELDQRYTFALFAADMSFEGSLMAGWGIVDTDVKPNEIYAYQVSVFEKTTPKPKATKVESASFMIGLKDYVLLPVVSDFSAFPDDKKILLSWNYEIYKKIYSSFMVEKSIDGINFEPVSKTPLVNLNDKPNQPAKNMYYVDTIGSNDKIYHYRLYGVSSFGEKGQLSKAVASKGITALTASPKITNYNIQKDNSVVLDWEFPVAVEKDVDRFEVNLSDKDNGVYKVVSEKLPPSARKFEYKNLEPSNYFTVTAVSKNNQKTTSQSMLVQPVDSIPPSIPSGLEGKIDSLGVVKLKWSRNLEKDFLGYRILRANNDKEEFVDIYHKAYEKEEYEDKVSLKMSNSKVYYRIASEDKRHNLSKPSAMLVLIKPDKIPPAAPIFKDFNTKDGKVFLKWIRSYSDDVAQYSLRRKEKGKDKWEEIKQINDTLQEFVDDKVAKNKTYQYAILARDKNNLWSSIENATITITVVNFKATPILTDVLGTPDRVNKKIILSWGYAKGSDKVVALSIYKNTLGQPPTLWREVSSKITTLEDTSLSINTEYEYQINPTLQNNTPAKTEKIIVKY
jgi:uncharacterized protein